MQTAGTAGDAAAAGAAAEAACLDALRLLSSGSGGSEASLLEQVGARWSRRDRHDGTENCLKETNPGALQCVAQHQLRTC